MFIQRFTQRSPFALLVGGLILALVATAGAVASPEWNWESGDVHYYRVTADTNQTVTGARTGHIKERVVFYWKLEVKEVNEGVATIHGSYETIQSSTEYSLIRDDMEFDSAGTISNKSEKHPVLRPHRRSVGESFIFKVDATGKILEVDAENVLSAILAGSEGAQTYNTQRLRYGWYYSNEAIERRLESLLHVLPPADSDSSEAWTHSYRHQHQFQGFIDSDETFSPITSDGSDGDSNVLKFKRKGTVSFIRLPEELLPPDPLAATFTPREGGFVTGEVEFDPTKGVLTRSQFTKQIDLGLSQTSQTGQVSEFEETLTFKELFERISKEDMPVNSPRPWPRRDDAWIMTPEGRLDPPVRDPITGEVIEEGDETDGEAKDKGESADSNDDK